MTQIIGAIYKGHAFLVSDRLLTVSHRNDFKNFDKKANKALVYRARDGILLIGYTGRAYLDGLPADQCMANALLGIEESRFPVAMTLPTSNLRWLDCGSVVRCLQAQLTKSFRHLRMKDRKMPYEVSVVGWRWRRHRRFMLPFACEIIKPKGAFSDFRLQYADRHWNWNKICFFQINPDRPERFKKALSKSIIDCNGLASPENFERGIVQFIRSLRRKEPTVGDTCTVIRLNPRNRLHVAIRYADPATEGKVFAKSPGTKKVPIEAYTPFVLAPPTAWGPAIVHGGGSWAAVVGGSEVFRWGLEGLEREKKPTQFFWGSQRRPTDPERG